MQRIAGSSSMARSFSCRSTITSGDMALRNSGRLSVSLPTPPSDRARIVSSISEGIPGEDLRGDVERIHRRTQRGQRGLEDALRCPAVRGLGGAQRAMLAE